MSAVLAPARIALAAITPSKTNPRKHFDPTKLAELAESIRKIDVVQPVLVRPINGGGEYELVAGERRFRAAKAAGLADIPATVRELTDAEVLEIQIIENIQRADLHELEEAEGYEHLLKCKRADGSTYSIDEIALKVGKSRSTVFGRVKLLHLCPEARKAFFDGEIEGQKALLIARIGHHDTQRAALKDLVLGPEQHGGWRSKEPMSYREAHQHILKTYMLALKSAPFDIKDEKLVAKAGACGPCPKRTGNQADLFGDVKSADVCTDPKCFSDKRLAHFAKAARELEAKGKKVLYGDDAKKAFPGWDSPNEYERDQLVDRYVETSGHTWVGSRNVPTRDLLGEGFIPTLIQHPATGEIVEVATRQAIDGASKKRPGQSGAKTSAAKAKGPKAPDIDDVLTERLATLMHEKAPKTFPKAWYVHLAKLLVENLSPRDLEAVALAWGWKANAFRSGKYGERRLPADAEKLGERDLVLLMFDLIFAISAYTRKPVLKLFGIDEQKVRDLIIEERKDARVAARIEAAKKKTAKKN